MDHHFTLEQARNGLGSVSEAFVSLFKHGSLEIEYYQPDKVDDQTPHERDEVYIVASGEGTFVNGDQRHAFSKGDVLFVPAGREHRFVDFSEDFATWVMFYGPEGGEKDQAKTLTAEEQMAQFEDALKEEDWGHQPC